MNKTLAKNKPRRRLLVIDADSFVYTVGHRVIRLIDLGDGNVTGTFSLADIRADINTLFSDMFDELDTRLCVLALSDPEWAWRRNIYPAYKQNRKPGNRPMAYGAVRDELAKKFDTIQEATLEADDLCGVLSTTEDYRYTEKIVVSPDKDLRTVPGYLYNPTHKTLDYITQEEADYNHMVQTLVGDVSDNFPGLPGVGPKKAEKILPKGESLKCLWDCVVKAFVAKGLTENDAIIQAQMAGILRNGQYDFSTKILRPWSPPQ